MRRWPYLLIVDDDEDFRAGLRTALELKGYVVDEAPDGERALEKLIEKPPLLMLLDLQMPRMNGRELLKKVRAAPGLREVPVVILSAFGFEWEAPLMGAEGYIAKPFEPETLYQTISSLLGPRSINVG